MTEVILIHETIHVDVKYKEFCQIVSDAHQKGIKFLEVTVVDRIYYLDKLPRHQTTINIDQIIRFS